MSERIEEAINFFENEIMMLRNAPKINGCKMTDDWKKQLRVFETALKALKEKRGN